MESIKELRKSIDLSQSQFAREFDIPLRTLQRWEQGQNKTPEYIIALIKRLLFFYDLRKNNNLMCIHSSKREMVRKCVHIAEANINIRKLVIFGSSVTEDCREDSDVDMCIFADSNYDKLKMHYTVVDLSKACNKNCDIMIYDTLTDYFKDIVMNTGVVVYESNN